MSLMKESVFVFGSSAGPSKVNVPSQGPWLLNKPNDSVKGLITKAEGAHSSTLRNGNNGENRELGNILQGQK